MRIKRPSLASATLLTLHARLLTSYMHLEQSPSLHCRRLAGEYLYRPTMLRSRGNMCNLPAPVTVSLHSISEFVASSRSVLLLRLWGQKFAWDCG